MRYFFVESTSARRLSESLVHVAAPVTALLWIYLRGVSVSALRLDSGLNRGRGLRKEIAVGLAAFLAIFPLVAMLPTLAMTAGYSPSVEELKLLSIVIFLVHAVVYAPLIEEFFFRGLLYRHLRTRHGLAASVALTTVLFVAIHTTHRLSGLAAAAIASVCMCTLREWRASSVSCVAFHAGYNGIPLILIALL